MRKNMFSPLLFLFIRSTYLIINLLTHFHLERQFYGVESMKLKLILIDQLLCARYCSKYFTHGLSDPFNPHNEPKKNGLLSPFWQMSAPVLAFPLCPGRSLHEAHVNFLGPRLLTMLNVTARICFTPALPVLLWIPIEWDSIHLGIRHTCTRFAVTGRMLD